MTGVLVIVSPSNRKRLFVGAFHRKAGGGVMDEIKKYTSERDAVLLTGDVSKLENFARKHGVSKPKEVTWELIMHKMITACTSLPEGYRQKSKAWLKERGFHSLDDMKR